MKNTKGALVALMAVGLVAVAAEPAWAASQVLHETCLFVTRLVRWLIGVSYVCGTIGMVLISIRASALGKFQMPNFAAIMMGMFVAGTIPSIVSFVIDGTFLLSSRC